MSFVLLIVDQFHLNLDLLNQIRQNRSQVLCNTLSVSNDRRFIMEQAFFL